MVRGELKVQVKGLGLGLGLGLGQGQGQGQVSVLVTHLLLCRVLEETRVYPPTFLETKGAVSCNKRYVPKGTSTS